MYTGSPIITDLNHDGNLDVVATGGSGNGVVSVFLGNGDGTLQAQVDYPAGQNPTGTISGDFNEDGNADVAVSNYYAAAILLFLGDGLGGLQSPISIPTGPHPFFLAANDLNSDGHLDLAVTNDNGVGTLLGNGDGTFQTPRDFPGPGLDIKTGDFNGDGKVDVALAEDQGAGVLFGNGDGTLQARLLYGGGVRIYRISGGDLNGDGRDDIVGGGEVFGTPQALVFLANSNGTMRARRDYTTPAQPIALALGDFNHDGHVDMISGDYYVNQVSVFLGKPDGTFEDRLDQDVGVEPAGIAVGDFNADGNLDAVVACATDNSINVLRGKGDGTFRAPAVYPVLGNPTGLGVIDLNGDGKLDIITTNNQATGSISVFLGNGNGTFQPRVDYDTGSYPSSIAIGDINGDHKIDVAVSDSNPLGNTTGAISVLLGNGDGTLQPHVEYAVGPNPNAPLFVVLADFNGDGKLDLAASEEYRYTVSVLLGNGDGSFQDYVDYGTGLLPAGLVAADFNGDGKIDLAVANTGQLSGDTLSILRGNGDGTFQKRVDYETGMVPYPLVATDFNGDGAMDLAAGSGLSSLLNVLLNTGGTALRLTSSLNPSHVGESVTFTLKIRQSLESGLPVPTGKVTFKDGNQTLGTATISGGKASFTTSTLSAGNHTIGALYQGDSNYNRHKAPALVQKVLP
jgi:hypothetical protein